MGTLLIGYDLNKSGQNYTKIIESIKALGAWWHYLDSTWIVKTSESAKSARDKLKTQLDANDELLVMDMTASSWASYGLPPKGNDWLRANL